jgi:flagellar FliJ protein
MFRFRLERVLQHRRREVDARSRDVAEALNHVQRAQDRRESVARDLQRHRHEGARQRLGHLDAGALQRLATWQDELSSRVRACEEAVADARAALATAQARLQQAWRDREVLERLRDRQRDEWRHEQARRERRALDEIGSIRSALAGRHEATVAHPTAKAANGRGKRPQ